VWQFHKYKRYSVSSTFSFTFHKKEYFDWIYFEIDLEWSKSWFDVEQQLLRFELGGVLASTILFFIKPNLEWGVCVLQGRENFMAQNVYNVFTFTILKGTIETRIESFLDLRYVFLLLDQTLKTFV
jgi:hypothetical protein